MPFVWPILLLLVFSYPLYASPFIVNVNEEMGKSIGKGNIEYLINEIYLPLGIKPSIKYLPNLRGLNLLNKGLIDAEFSRYEKVALAYPNLIKVSEPMAAVEVGLFCLSKTRCHLDMNTIYMRTKRTMATKNFCVRNDLLCREVKRDAQAFELMLKVPQNIYIAEYLTAVSALCNSSIKHIYYRDFPFLSNATYHWIHTKHKELLDQLTDSIKKAKEKISLQQQYREISRGENKCNTKITRLSPIKGILD